MAMATEQRDLVTKDDLLRVENGLRAEIRQVRDDLHAEIRQVNEDLRAALRQVTDDMRVDLGHYATKGDLWRGIAFQTIAFTAIVAALTKL
jgi:hypothetical protein